MRVTTSLPGVASCCLILLLTPLPPAAGEEVRPLRGADAILKELADLDAPPPAAAPGAADALTTRLGDWRGDIGRFDGASLPPAEAARGWLGLFDRWETAGRELASAGVTVAARELPPFRLLLGHLPPPAAWEALTVGLLARAEGDAWGDVFPARASLLGALAATLRNDEAALDASVTWLLASAKGNNRLAQTASALRAGLLAGTDDPDRAARLFRATLPAPVDAAAATAGGAAPAGEEESFNPGELELPDLVTVLGKERAELELREALRRPVLLAVAHAGERTAAAARRLAQEHVDELALPQWNLTHSVEAGALFEALERRFVRREGAPPPTLPARVQAMASFQNERQQQQAGTYYVLGLVAHGRVDDALAFVKTRRGVAAGGREAFPFLPHEAVEALRGAGRSREVFDFLSRLLAEGGAVPSWDTYLSLAADVGRLDDVIALAEKAAARADLPAADRRNITGRLGAAYLAADRVEDGLRVLRGQIAEATGKGDGTDEEGDASEIGNFGLNLVRVGTALGRPELVEEGLRAVHAILHETWATPGPKPPPSSPAVAHRRVIRRFTSGSSLARETAALLAETGRGAEAEDVLRQQLLADRRKEAAERRERLAQLQSNRSSYPVGYLRYQLLDSNQGGRETRGDLIELASLYARLGRPADALALLERAPGWGAADLGEILTQADDEGAPVGFLAARALADVGRSDDARRVLRALFDAGAAWDPAYALFTKLSPPEEALRELDALAARDPFEERPLIWRAETLLRLGRPAEAETAARAAIAVDPSDGEQGRGRRMQAYVTLANVLTALGKERDAELPRAAVRAIRLSEDADRFHRAGLLTRAVTMYDQALTIFSDAYCIQSRLAVQLVALGRTDEAESHYQRAFELMPGSFGRVESHCFGCEGAFSGRSAQSVAERVFTRLAAETPARPQVFYLLGYLRKEQRRYAEALAATRRAVELDPDYLNAWKRIASDLPDHIHVPGPVADAARLSVFRLDPNGRHGRADLEKVHDLRALWTTVAGAQGRLAPAETRCLPLPASAAQAASEKERIEKLLGGGVAPAAPGGGGGAEEGDEEENPFLRFSINARKSRPSGPAETVSRQETLQSVARGLDAAAKGR